MLQWLLESYSVRNVYKQNFNFLVLMKYSLETRREVTDLVTSEIERHRAGEITTFTTYTALVAEYGVPIRTIRDWMKVVISTEDIQYRARIIKENLLDHIPHDVQARLKRGRSVTMKRVRTDMRVAREDYFGPSDDHEKDYLLDLIRELT